MSKPTVITLAAAIILTLLSVGAVDARDATRIPITVNGDSHLIVDVHIGRRGPFPFLIDSASSATFVGLSLVAELELVPLRRARITVRSVGGDRRRKLYQLGTIEIGPVTYDLPVVAAIPDRRRESGPVFGILGGDFLSRHLTEFDLGRQELVLHSRSDALPASDGWYWMAADFARLGIPFFDGRIAGRDLTIILDTGARTSVVNRAFMTALGISAPASVHGAGHRVTGSDQTGHEGWRLAPTEFRMGGVRVVANSLIFADLPVFRLARLDDAPAMIMGMDLLAGRRFSLDYLRERIGFVVEQTGDHPTD